MVQNQERYEDHLDGPHKSIHFSTRTSPPTPSMTETANEDETLGELDEPPENDQRCGNKTNFHRSTIRPKSDRKESLLTKALLSSPDTDTFRPEIRLVTDVGRRRSFNSNTSTLSSGELTSDGGLTSPARTTTPSPPIPSTLTHHMASLNLGPKANLQNLPPLIRHGNQSSRDAQLAAQNIPASTKAEPTVEALAKKRCITFACARPKPAPQLPPKCDATTVSTEERRASTTSNNPIVPRKRECAIKFACSATVNQGIQVSQPATKPAEVARRQSSRSPTLVRKSRPASSPRLANRTLPSGSRRTSRSPLATRRKRPAFLTSNKSVQSSEATRFHEFASGEVEEDDWIRRDSSDNKKKLTINDTLRKENAIRQLGKEAEEEALQEEEDEEQDNDDDDDQQDSDGEEHEENSDGESDGNETDNEAGFADSDEESDDEEFQFWTSGKPAVFNAAGEASTYRPSAHRTTSESSSDSPRRMSPPAPWSDASARQRKPKSARRPKIRPGTPDLPDSTDFVCGTLDEDRPLEDAYVSCMEVRKREKHRAVPQDIDPSFPTSDPENDEDEDEDRARNESDEPISVWMHGKFEESDEHDREYRRSRKRSPLQSPKRMHSPPPQKTRLRSPAPRRLFGGASPRRMRSPAPMRHVESPRASPASHVASNAITFTPLGQRPGLTHTKSLPRTPNAFCKQYRAARLAAANADLEYEETTDGYTRGAIDIVKGLERKMEHRKEKLLRKHNNRARKGAPERKPQPGEGAERMRELALHMTGKGGAGKAQYVLSV